MLPTPWYGLPSLCFFVMSYAKNYMRRTLFTHGAPRLFSLRTTTTLVTWSLHLLRRHQRQHHTSHALLTRYHRTQISPKAASLPYPHRSTCAKPCLNSLVRSAAGRVTSIATQAMRMLRPHLKLSMASSELVASSSTLVLQARQ